MTMFDIVFPDPDRTQKGLTLLRILASVDRNNIDPGRFRDSWIERGDDGEPVIAIYTRNGGGNRECSCESDDHGVKPGTCTGCVGARFASRADCIDSRDDTFDSTYRTYYFRVPAQYRSVLASVAGEHVDTDKRWLDAIAALGAARPDVVPDGVSQEAQP